MTEDERARWEARYREDTADSEDTGDPYEAPAEPSPLLVAFAEALPDGRALDVATGTGRNAAFLAERGWTVHAVDVAREALVRGRTRTIDGPGSVEWIQADVDTYCLRPASYDVVTVTFFDARGRLGDLQAALAPGGVLCYEHYLLRPERDGEHGGDGPGDRYRFAPNELLSACDDLTVLYYAEREVEGRALVRLVARNSTRTRQEYPAAAPPGS